MKSPNPPIQFLNFQVRESHLVFHEIGNYNLGIKFNPKGIIFTSLNQFVLQLNVIVKDKKNKFKINIVTESLFTYPEDADIEAYKTGLFIHNAPAIVFPYIRAYISSLTALAGIPALTLPTLSLAPLGETLKANIEVQE